ncbi:MAG: AAA family ATPase [Rhodocyclaceae bacterium]|nr:AAA family ATPase [Rhodocyclaceae bacterium]
MPDIQQEIRDWLHAQPDWLQQAAEILLTKGSAAEPDIESLVERLKTSEGRQVTSHRSFAGLSPAPAPATDLRLLEIGDISGIENLGPRSPLAFGAGNLCVMYGPNGSGKSGYTRLLKKACGKPRATELKPNVFQPLPAERKCRISFQVAGAAQQVEWPANGAPVDQIRSVDIFDSDAAVSYLTEETTASYTPPSVSLFEALAVVCDRIKAQLQAQQDRLTRELPAVPAEYAATQAGAAYGALKSDLSEAEIQSIIEWREEDRQALEQLTERLKPGDLAALAREKRNTKAQAQQLVSLLEEVAAAFGEKGLVSIRAMRAEAINRRRIATQSAQVASAKLDGIGSETWRALWEAARAYSQIAYPGKQYPATDDALCVLCHQNLGLEAKLRLQDFENFVQGKLEAEAETAEKAYRQALDEMPAALTAAEIATRCQAADLTEESWTEALGDFWGRVSKARHALLGGEFTEAAMAVVLPAGVIAKLTARADSLAREAAQHDLDAQSFDRKKAEAGRVELEAQRWVSQQSVAIRAEITRLQQVGTFESWKRLANSYGITVKAGEVAQQVITTAFVDGFNRELKALGAARIKVELFKTRTEKGRALHRLRLKGTQTDHDLPGAVLSDGERRIVGLAAFLADVAEKPHVAPFVFDDPISSLDHDFEWCVAVRLAQLAKNRQVLVFTHRLSLYGAMEDAARKLGEEWKQDHLHQHCIESFSGVAGHPVDQAAWMAKTTKANNLLLMRLGEAKKAGENFGADAFRNLAQGICSDFRKLLERTVEDDLLNSVVKRHRRSVTTDNKLAALSRIDLTDCKFIDELMSKYSCYEHSQSPETPVFIPEEAELRADLESLKMWREDFKKRQAQANP